MAGLRILALLAAFALVSINLSEAQQQTRLATVGWLGTGPALGPTSGPHHGADRAKAHKRVGSIAARILKGTKPADIPVEQPTKFELVINLKAAKQIGKHSSQCFGQSGSRDSMIEQFKSSGSQIQNFIGSAPLAGARGSGNQMQIGIRHEVREVSKKKIIGLALCALFATFSVAAAQQNSRVYRLGFLSPATRPDPSIPTTSTLVPKLLRESGYVEGQNLQVQRRFAEGKLDRLPQLAKELVDLQMDVLVAVSPTAIKPALDATKAIPIVMGFGKDPVRDGFISSLAKPGGNITGVVVAPEDVLAGKRLELLKEAVPGAGTIAVLATSEPSSKLQIKEAQRVAPALGLKLLVVELQDSDYDEAFTSMTRGRANGLFVLASPILNAGRDRIIQLAGKHRVPTIYEWPEHAELGGMMAYGSSLARLSGRVAWYVERILKGAKPADLPVEQPTKFELVINLKAAKQIGLTIPPGVLARADRVIR